MVVAFIIFAIVAIPSFSVMLFAVLTVIGGLLVTFPINLIVVIIILLLRHKYKDFLRYRKQIRKKFLGELGWWLVLFFVPIALSEILIAISGGTLLTVVSPILRMCHLSGYVDELKAMKKVVKFSSKQMLKKTRNGS